MGRSFKMRNSGRRNGSDLAMKWCDFQKTRHPVTALLLAGFFAWQDFRGGNPPFRVFGGPEMLILGLFGRFAMSAPQTRRKQRFRLLSYYVGKANPKRVAIPAQFGSTVGASAVSNKESPARAIGGASRRQPEFCRSRALPARSHGEPPPSVFAGRSDQWSKFARTGSILQPIAGAA